jgi:arylsulfatase A-like enzyme
MNSEQSGETDLSRGEKEPHDMRRVFVRATAAVATVLGTAIFCLGAGAAHAQQQRKPNILVIWGDDIGWYNVSAYNMGVMGYKTPNIDRLAKEGAMFTDWYGQQSCTAGRAAFITGQSPIRTGLTKVGLPGADVGLRPEDPTIAELLKPLGYAAGQFGKNHLGDRDEFLPTAHGFDEFFGNLYHLNAEEEPENVDYPKDPEFKKRFGPRGVIHSLAGGKIQDTGPLTKSRMETVDDEITAGALRFIEQQHKAGKPFFVWWNSTRMHIWTHLKKESAGKTGLGIYPDGMVEHDAHVGQLLRKLDELGIAGNTIVMYSTDNGAETFTWPDGGTTPFRGEKATNWEGGYRVPALIRWPGTIKPGTVYNDPFAHEDMLPTILAATGVPDVKERLRKGYTAGGKTFKVHLDVLRPGSVLQGRGEGAPAQGIPLLERRRQARGAALQPVEARLLRAAPPRVRRVGRTVRGSALAGALRSALRSLRARKSRIDRLRAVEDRARLPAGAGAGLSRQLAGYLQGVPTEAEAGELQPRPGDAEAHRSGRQHAVGAPPGKEREQRERLRHGVMATGCRTKSGHSRRAGLEVRVTSKRWQLQRRSAPSAVRGGTSNETANHQQPGAGPAPDRVGPGVCADGPAALVERRTGQEGDCRVRASHHRQG